MSRRHYNDNAPATTLTGTIDSDDTDIGLLSLIGFPTTRPYTGTMGRGTASAEQVLVTNVVGSTVTVTRNYNGQGAFTHTSGEKFEHTANAIDFDEANAHIQAGADVHGVSGALVGTSNPQTLTNKVLSGGTATFVAEAGTPGVVITTTDADSSVGFEVKNHAGTVVMKVLGSGATTVAGLTNTGNETVAGTLGVTGAVTLSAGATVTGIVTLNDDLAVTGDVTANDITASGVLTGASGSFAGSVAVGDDLTVADDAAIGGDLAVTGTATITGLLTNPTVIKRVADATVRNALTPGATRQPIYRDDMSWVEIWDGSAWRVQGVGIVDTIAHLALITDPVEGQLASVTDDDNYYRWTGVKWKAVPPSVPQGIFSTSNSSAINTTETVVLTATNVVFRAGVAYEAHVHCGLFGDAVGRLASVRLRKTNAAGADWGEYYRMETKGISGATAVPGGGMLYLVRTAATDLTATVVVTLQASAGTVTMLASAATPRRLVIVPVGDATDFANFGVDVT